MILADKIINERKKNGWSQEELAEQLAVSRQSVSKWEGAQAVPDIQKIIKMSELFGVSTDYLLKDDLGESEKEGYRNLSEAYETLKPARSVSLEEASTFIKVVKEQTPMLANAISMCILSPVALIFLAGLSDETHFGITEKIAVVLGLVILFALIATAVFFFITIGTKLKPYEYLEKEEIETEYGVIGMVKERREAYQNTYTSKLSIGIILCIVSAVPLIVAAVMEAKDVFVVAMVCVCLILVSIGVNFIIRVSKIWQSFDQLLQEEDYTSVSKKANGIVENIGGVYWTIITAIYLAMSFLTTRWEITWVIWPIAGVVFGTISVFTKAYVSSKNK